MTIHAKVDNSIVHLQITAGDAVVLGLRAAYGLMMMAAGISWSTEKLTQYDCHLHTDFAFTSDDNTWPTQTTKALRVTGSGVSSDGDDNAPYEKLWFILGPHPDQIFELDRVEVLRALNDYFVGLYGKELLLQDSYVYAVPDDEGRYIESGQDGIYLSLGSYVNFTAKVGSAMRDICNVQFFTGNQNCTRPNHVEKLCFVTDVYTDGYHGKDVKAAIRHWVGNGNPLMLES